jgi:tetratricopeptide (TPR) repeat protein
MAGGGTGGMGGPAAQGAVSTVTATGEANQTRTGGDQVAEARERLATGEAAEAEALLEDALRTQESRSADVTFLLAETYARQGKWSAAARTYDLFLARYLDDPRADEARWRAADAYRRTGAVTRAAALLQQLVGVPGYDSRARASLDDIAVETSAESTAGPAVETGAAAAAPASAEMPADTGSLPAAPPP